MVSLSSSIRKCLIIIIIIVTFMPCIVYSFHQFSLSSSSSSSFTIQRRQLLLPWQQRPFIVSNKGRYFSVRNDNNIASSSSSAADDRQQQQQRQQRKQKQQQQQQRPPQKQSQAAARHNNRRSSSRPSSSVTNNHRHSSSRTTTTTRSEGDISKDRSLSSNDNNGGNGGKRTSNYYTGKSYLLHQFEKRQSEIQSKHSSGQPLTQTDVDSLMALAISTNSWSSVPSILSLMSSHSLQQERSTYQSCLQSCHDVGNGNAARSVLRTMMTNGITPGALEVGLTVRALCPRGGSSRRRGMWREAWNVLKEWEEEEGVVVEDEEVYEVLIGCMGKEGRWREVTKLLNEMERKADEEEEEEEDDGEDGTKGRHVRPTLRTYHAVLEVYLNCERSDESTRLLKLMRQRGVMPVTHTYNLLISTLLRQNLHRQAISLLSAMSSSSSSTPPSTVTYNTVIAACAKARDTDQALQLLSQMTHSKTPPDVISYNSVMAACANEGKWREALRLLTELQNSANDLHPDVISYTSAIRACAKAKKTKRALSLWNDAKDDDNVVLDGYVYASVMDACAKGGLWRKALELLEEMKLSENGLRGRSEAVAYGAAVAACGNGGRWEKAWELLEEMKGRGMRINLITYNSAISALAKASSGSGSGDDGRVTAMELYDRASHLISEIESNNLHPDSFSYSGIISICGAAGKWQEALQYLSLMKTSRSGPRGRPNNIAYTAAITACGRSGEWERAWELFEAMEGEGVMIDTVTYNALLAALRMGGKRDMVVDIWNEMCGNSHANRRPNTSSSSSSSYNNRPVIARSMRDDSISPDIITLTDVLSTLSDANDYDDRSDAIFSEAVERGIVLKSNSLDSPSEVDLSGMAFPVAKTALRHVLMKAAGAVGSSNEEEEEGLTFITGVGRWRQQQQQQQQQNSSKEEEEKERQTLASTSSSSSQQQSSLGLREYVRQVLREEFNPPIQSIVPDNAKGTVVLERNDLRKWKDAHRSS